MSDEPEDTKSDPLLLEAISAMSDGFVVYDSEGCLKICNESFRHIYGYSEEEMVPGVTTYDGLGALDEAYSSDDRKPFTFAQRLAQLRRDGPSVVLQFYGERTYERHQSATPSGGLIGITTDITDLKRAEAELERAVEIAEHANLAKSEFLATMSHEIRTPMTGVMGFADALLEDSLPGDSTAKVEKIKESTQILLRILDEVLDISKLEAGKMEIENLDFHLPSIVREVVSMFEGSGRETLKINLSLTENCPEAVNGDPTRIRQILLNLVGNAVKFTKQGRVNIDVGLERTEGDRDHLRFVVRDTGIGIAEETKAKLFSDFTQGDASITREFEGTGLGLAICKRLVELMSGTIGVESELGVGSAFWFMLPYVAATSEVSAQSADMSSKTLQIHTSRSLTILVAEDNLINQAIIGQVLTIFGHKFEMVGDGGEAVESHEATDFDLIIMDVRMPKVSGPDATKMIRRMQGDKSRIPIMACTADVMTENQKEYLDVGMNAVATKPIDRTELAMAINAAMGADIHTFVESDDRSEDG